MIFTQSRACFRVKEGISNCLEPNINDFIRSWSYRLRYWLETPWQPQVAIEKQVFPDQLQMVAVKMIAKAPVTQG